MNGNDGFSILQERVASCLLVVSGEDALERKLSEADALDFNCVSFDF